MKKIILSALLFAFSSAFIASCKKGEDDPAISLRSRKARFAGEWMVSQMTSTSTESSKGTEDNDGYIISGSQSFSFNGTDYSDSGTEKYTSNGYTFDYQYTSKGPATFKYTFDKDGTFKAESTLNLKEDANQTESNGTTVKVNSTISRTTTISGTWSFLYGSGDELKNKERVGLSYLSSTQRESITRTVTYTYVSNGLTITETDEYVETNTDNSTFNGQEVDEVWQLTQLKNKEMIVQSNTTSSTNEFSRTRIVNGNETRETGSFSGTGNSTMTLIQD